MPPNKPTDEELLHAYIAGDAAAFEGLYDRYERRIFGFFVRAFGDRGRAEDLLQQAFLNVHRARRRYRGGGFAAWMHAIAYNLYREECRRRARKPESALEFEPATDAPELDRRVDAAHELERVRRVIEELPGPQREAVVLCRLLELDYASAAKIVGCSAGAMKLRAFRGLRAVRAGVDARDSGDEVTAGKDAASSKKRRPA